MTREEVAVELLKGHVAGRATMGFVGVSDERLLEIVALADRLFDALAKTEPPPLASPTTGASCSWCHTNIDENQFSTCKRCRATVHASCEASHFSGHV